MFSQTNALLDIYTMRFIIHIEIQCPFFFQKFNINDEVSAATGLSPRTIGSLASSLKNNGKDNAISSPKKKKGRSSQYTPDSFDECVIRRCIYDFHIKEKMYPTIRRLLPALQESIGFDGSETTLIRMVKKMGFKWCKTQDNLSVLREKPDIIFKRISYLRAIRRYREDNRPIVYTDETYIHTTHAPSISWSDKSGEGMKIPISKGSRFIIVHAGSEKGFIPNALLMYKSHQKTGDYHDDMNFTNYQKWLTEKLIPNLEPRSVVIIDNASYHNKLVNPAPTSNSKKADMIQWLTRKDIPFSSNMLKPELYRLICLHKSIYKEFAIDKLLTESGHDVLRLPPYHPDLNPIENIWSIIKGYVASKNVDMTLSVVEKLVKEKMSSVTSVEWDNVCRHACQKENEYWERDVAFDDFTENHDLFFNVSDDESDNTSDCDE
jgi:transposase